MSSIKLKKRCPNCFCETGSLPCGTCGYTRSSPENDANMLPRGTKLGGKYITGGVIGRGGFGATYLAYDVKNEKITAVKEYFPASLSYRQRSTRFITASNEKNAAVFSGGLERFYNESEQVSEFNGNPNIVNVYDCFLENNTAYFAMEYLRGITLEKYVSENGALSIEQTVYLGRRLSAALIAVHSAGMLHRDIAPDNIMLCEDGKVKLLDFGAARKLSEETSLTIVMKTGFTAAEQYSGRGNFGAWTDIYSVGAVMFYALTGKAPASVYSRMEDDSAFEAALADIPKPLRCVIIKAASIDPRERYESAASLRNALEALGITEESAVVTVNLNYTVIEADTSKKTKISPVATAALVGAVSAAALTAAIAAVTPFKSDVYEENLPPSYGDETPFGQIVYNTADNSSAGRVRLDFGGEYAGDMKPCGLIPAETLESFGGDVKIVLEAAPHNVVSDFYYGFRPVDGADRCMLEYLSAAGDPLADTDGFIHLNMNSSRYVFVISREGIEALEGGLCFKAYGAAIVSAELSAGKPQKPYKFNKYPDYLTSELSAENGRKYYSADITHYIVNENEHNVTQYVPVAPLLELGGDAAVTVTFESEEDSYENTMYFSTDWNCKSNTGKLTFTEQRDELGRELLVRPKSDNWFRVDPKLRECTFILPRGEIEKMVGGFTFVSRNMIMKHVTIESA